MMADRPGWAPEEVDPAKPSVARVYDYYLGGSHNFESDRAFGQQALELVPRSSTDPDGQPGVPAPGRPAAAGRWVLTSSLIGLRDTDGGKRARGGPGGQSAGTNCLCRSRPGRGHAQPALLRGNDRATAIADDIRDPQRVLADAVATGLLELGRPIGVLMIAVMHFIDDADRPAELISEYMGAVAPGSYLALSHPLRVAQPTVVNAARSTTSPDRRTPCGSATAPRSRRCSVISPFSTPEPWGCRCGIPNC